jgi:hypothetical protein
MRTRAVSDTTLQFAAINETRCVRKLTAGTSHPAYQGASISTEPMEVCMKRLFMLGLVAGALAAAATGVLKSHPSPSSSTVGLASATVAQQSGSAAHANLPVEDFDDRSLVFPRETRR